jgi:hypothetical protein
MANRSPRVFCAPRFGAAVSGLSRDAAFCASGGKQNSAALRLSTRQSGMEDCDYNRCAARAHFLHRWRKVLRHYTGIRLTGGASVCLPLDEQTLVPPCVWDRPFSPYTFRQWYYLLPITSSFLPPPSSLPLTRPS